MRWLGNLSKNAIPIFTYITSYKKANIHYSAIYLMTWLRNQAIRYLEYLHVKNQTEKRKKQFLFLQFFPKKQFTWAAL